MVNHDVWLDCLERLLAFRHHLRQMFGVPIRAELKASYLLRNGGPHFSRHPLSESARCAIYGRSMRLQPKLGLNCFAVVIYKRKAAERYPGRSPQDIAWEWLFQRLERRAHYEKDHVLLIHDEGDESMVRKLARKARRAGTAGSAFRAGTVAVPFRRLIDDPVPKDSRQSHLLQLADLSAYAAFRKLIPPPPRPYQIVPQGMWDELGSARFQAVTGGAIPLGIVHN
jgi:hypothetical protein